MQLDLTDEEMLALLNLLTEMIETDRCPFSQRIRTLRGILTKFGPMGPRSATASETAETRLPLAIYLCLLGSSGLVAFLLVAHASRRRSRRDAGLTATTIAGTITRRGTAWHP